MGHLNWRPHPFSKDAHTFQVMVSVLCAMYCTTLTYCCEYDQKLKKEGIVAICL